MMYSKIIGTGGYLPSRIVSNDELSQSMQTSDEWIYSRTGIRQRHLASPDESCSDMAFYAAKRALENAHIEADAIDLIIVATSTPEHIFPSTATVVQSRLSCQRAAAFDVQAACTGFMYALNTADCFIKSGQYQNILVIGAEVFSRIVDWQDRNTAVLFGDGAGAVVLSASEEAGILGTILHADGSHKELLWVPQGIGSSETDFATRRPFIEMQGREVFKFAVRSLTHLVSELLVQCQMSADEIDFLIPHQANSRIIQAVAEHLNLPIEKVIITVNQHANTSAASVPLALDYGVQNGIIKRGDNLLLEAFGGGFTWGGCILTY